LQLFADDVSCVWQTDDGYVEVYNALDDVSVENTELSAVQRRIPYDLFRQVMSDDIIGMSFKVHRLNVRLR